jgi:hypothetical protein
LQRDDRMNKNSLVQDCLKTLQEEAGRGPELVNVNCVSYRENHDRQEFDSLMKVFRKYHPEKPRGPTWHALLSQRSLDPFVTFVKEMAVRLSPESVLDPTCGFGLALTAAVTASGSKVGHGIDINEQSVDVASLLGNGLTEIIHGDAFEKHDSLLDKYDLVISDPPLNSHFEKRVLEKLKPKIPSWLQFQDALAVWTCSRLSERGKAIVVVTPAFFYTKKAKALKAINEAGCRIAAVVQQPSGFKPNTSIATYILVIEPGEQEDLFVAQLGENEEQVSTLVKNLIARRSKGDASVGRLCNLEKFRGFEQFQAEQKLERLARKSGNKKVKASSLLSVCSKCDEASGDSGSEIDSPSFFLKLNGKIRASTTIDELRTGYSKKAREVVRLKVNPELASTKFLVRWFNRSRDGRLLVDSLSVGSTIPRINIRDLLAAEIFLPSIQDQNVFLESNSFLAGVKAEVEGLEKELDVGSEDPAKLLARIKKINQTEYYKDWIETLPFPLASILWRHLASKDSYRQRYEVLLHFFEATAAFLATVHLSAFMKDENLWAEQRVALNKKLTDQKLSFERVTFGAWRLAAELLGKHTEVSLDKSSGETADSEKRGQLERMYGSTDPNVLKLVCDKRLRTIIQLANKIRNDWHGHSGAINEEVAKTVHENLFQLVKDIRDVWGRGWSEYEMIQPGGLKFREGIYNVSCKRLMGSRSEPFEEVEIESREPLEDGSLYLFDRINRKGLQLRPFISVMPSPEKKATACYIYSRAENDGSRWISYHFTQEAEIQIDSPGLNDALRMMH